MELDTLIHSNSPPHDVNNDEGTIIVPSGSNYTSNIQSHLITLNSTGCTINFPTLETLFQLYPDDPEAGVLTNPGPELLAVDFLDKKGFLVGNAIEHSIRRWLSTLFSETKSNNSAAAPVINYRFSQFS